MEAGTLLSNHPAFIHETATPQTPHKKQLPLKLPTKNSYLPNSPPNRRGVHGACARHPSLAESETGVSAEHGTTQRVFRTLP